MTVMLQTGVRLVSLLRGDLILAADQLSPIGVDHLIRFQQREALFMRDAGVFNTARENNSSATEIGGRRVGFSQVRFTRVPNLETLPPACVKTALAKHSKSFNLIDTLPADY